MIENIFAILIWTGLIVGAVWGISVKTRELKAFVKKNGWGPVKVKVWKLFKEFSYKLTFGLLILGYLLGSVYLSLSLEDNTSINKDYIGYIISLYFFIGFTIFYYANGIIRRKTKNIKIIFNQDFVVLKEKFKEFIQGIGTLAKAILILAGWLLAIGAIILAFILFGWFIASLSATTIIIILLVLIVLK